MKNNVLIQKVILTALGTLYECVCMSITITKALFKLINSACILYRSIEYLTTVTTKQKYCHI